MPRVLAFAGSARRESLNKKLVKIAAAGAESAGADVTFIDLADFAMPLFNEDLERESGMPDNARAFKNLLIAHDGFLIASPEYNGAFSALLKNAIDWASRRETQDDVPLLAFENKIAAIMAASPGQFGGMRGLVLLRILLGNIGVFLLPQQQTIPFANKAFSDTGALLDGAQQQAVMNLGVRLAQWLSKVEN